MVYFVHAHRHTRSQTLANTGGNKTACDCARKVCAHIGACAQTKRCKFIRWWASYRGGLSRIPSVSLTTGAPEDGGKR